MKIMCAISALVFGMALFILGLYLIAFSVNDKEIGIYCSGIGNILSTLGLIVISREE
ncbi:MAG: hypothetical protein IJH34_07565 [Romboutsia sp.]|nr:hypothetical protein [Romboutsia sp.]